MAAMTASAWGPPVMNKTNGNLAMRYLALGCGLLAVLLLPACSSGPKLVKVKGNLRLKDQPYTAKHTGSLSIRLIPVVEADEHFHTYVGDFNREDGSFVVNGKTGQGIPTGKYLITIHQRLMDAPPEILEMNERFSQPNSKIIREIVDETPLVINLSTPTGE